jgi:tripartite-type tricarboxylate transporter receptor subunit TctC
MVRWLLAVMFACLGPAVAAADTFPNRSIRLIIPFPAGGPVDVLGRGLGEWFRQRTGQGFVIEPRPGANTALAGAACKEAAKDGYTLCLLASTTVSINPNVNSNLRYAPADLAPVTNIAISRAIMLLHRDVPASNLQEMVEWSKLNPEKMNYGSFGAGSETHLVMEWIKSQTGARVTHVPFQGLAPALQAFDRGDVQIFMPTATQSTMDLIASGKARPILVLSDSPSDRLPNALTITQAGLPPLGVQTWFGMFAPAGTPPEIVAMISTELRAIVRDEKFAERFIRGAGLIPEVNTPEEFAAFLERDRRNARELVQTSGVRLTGQ